MQLLDIDTFIFDVHYLCSNSPSIEPYNAIDILPSPRSHLLNLHSETLHAKPFTSDQTTYQVEVEQTKIEVPRDVRYAKSGHMTS